MKKLTIDYILYIYQNFIVKNKSGDIYKTWTKSFMRLLEYLYDLYIWIFALVAYLPFLLISMTIGKKLKMMKFQFLRAFINYTNNNNNNNYKIN